MSAAAKTITLAASDYYQILDSAEKTDVMPVIEDRNTLEPHQYADIFPVLDEAELVPLAADIAKYGLRDPIMLYAGKILDGRNRLAACRMAEVEPTLTEFEGSDQDAVNFVVSRNLHRRHLTESQRAMAAARLATLGDGQTKRGASIEAPAAVTQPEAARMLNVGRATVQKARAVLESGDQELVEKVERGETRVHAAYDRTREARKTKKKKAHVVRSADPELAARVKRGEVTLEKAYQETRAAEETVVPPEPQQSRSAGKRSITSELGKLTALAKLAAQTRRDAQGSAPRPVAAALEKIEDAIREVREELREAWRSEREAYEVTLKHSDEQKEVYLIEIARLRGELFESENVIPRAEPS